MFTTGFAGAVQAVYCAEMMAELSEKLRHTFGFSENRIHAVIHDVRRFAERVEISGTLNVVSADPDDDKFIECAVVGQANVIVSGDNHLLDVEAYQDIPIMSPARRFHRLACRTITYRKLNQARAARPRKL